MDSFFICRQIMRIYTCLDYDTSTLCLKPNICPTITQQYFEYEGIFKEVFFNADIEMYPMLINSCFNNVIKLMPEVAFIDKTQSYTVPTEVISILSDFLASQEIFHEIPTTAVKVYGGYTGRVWERETNSRLATDGLQRSETNDIIIDFFLYKKAPFNTLLYRLTHELLHTLGFDEAQTLEFTDSACIYMTEHMSENLKKFI